ncbi:outer membrane autotransporter barrel domain-containing protein [Bartonella sp. DB5-6]|uniref:autotransporter outer membrane beta-barrel domain-containing protein n=1 Tax=Bartonella sp. DB5-6 TaxID=1094755 RepID=UPI00026E931A|nr:autotransporter outer membrane beta-barrel domain-containing protein [Bartonella sp. DB5-6]EJF76673.1 outer membrane autotransporter barrel domain-containing protein [Bartonella sp. DB5-6]
MYKKSLLSYTTAAAIILFNIQFNAHAETLEVSQGEKKVANETYEIIHAKDGGQIIGDHLTVVGNKDTNQSIAPNQNINESAFAVTAEGNNSTIKLNNTTIQGSDSVISLGIMAKDGATLQMTGGTITVSGGGAVFSNSKSNGKNNENKLEDVTISSGKDDAPLINAIIVSNSTVALKDVIVKQATSAIIAHRDSKITVSGGSFEAEQATIFAQNGGTVTLTNSANITSSNDVGLHAKGSKNQKATINMTGGTVTGKNGALIAQDSGHIVVENVSLKTTDSDKSFGVLSSGEGSVVELLGEKTNISDSTIGLTTNNGGTIKMTGGTIKASLVGAGFLNSSSKNTPNQLKDVKISSGKDDELLKFGIRADKSTVILDNVEVTQAATGIVADNNSKITVSEGSFNAQMAAISAYNSSTITLSDNVNVTSSNDVGLYANGSKSTINMTGGTVTGKNGALNAQDSGHIVVKNVSLKTTDSDVSFGAFSSGEGSVVELLGEKTNISDSTVGLIANEGGAIKMTGGTITTSIVGANSSNSNSNKNKPEDVPILNGKGDAQQSLGAIANKNSTIILKDVTVTQATNALVADDHSTITASGGSFNAQMTTISAHNSSTITLTDSANVTSSNDVGLYANGSKSTINMTGGTVTGKNSALAASDGGHVTVKDVALKATGDVAAVRSVVVSVGASSVVELLGKTTINDSEIGLATNDSGAIKMTGGTIKTSIVGASFLNSNSNENNLEDVKISSSEDDSLLEVGIAAEKSTVVLKDVTVTQAETGIFADDHSTITVSGGSFDAQGTTIFAQNGSTVTLTDNAKIASSDGDGLVAEGSGSKIIMLGGTATAKNKYAALYAKDRGQIDATAVTLTTDGKGAGAVALGPKSIIKLQGHTTINNTFNGLGAIAGGKITSEDLTVIGGEAINSAPDKERTGVWTEDAGSEIHLTGKTTIKNVDEGLYANGGSKIVSGDLTITGSESEKNTGVGAYGLNTSIELNGKTVLRNFDVGLVAANNSTIRMINGAINTNKIEAKKVALLAGANGHINLANASVTAGVAGLQFIYLFKDDLQKDQNNEINLTNADIHIENGAGIFVETIVEKSIENNATPSIGTANLKNSKIHADVLLDDGILWNKIWEEDKNWWGGKDVKKISNGTFTLSADHSTLEGRAKIAQERNVLFDLKNKTTWTLKTSTKEKDDEGNLLDIAQRSRSDISVLNLNDSSIVFDALVDGHYHTLHIGSGKPDTKAVYNASGDAKIYFNTTWSDGVAIADQKTNRLLIHGNVSGNTTVYIKSDLGNKNSVVNASDPSNMGGLSLIQVSGEAKEDSFKLAQGYTTIRGEPYKYTLTGYGPTSSHGNADIAQNLFDEKNENFWDFRLHKAFLDTGSDSVIVPAPVPQMASYLVMPNALFTTGLTDMAKQNTLLANMRTSVVGNKENNGFFLYTYGSTGTLSSERGPLEYGYGADIRYAAIQAGLALPALERQNTTTHFGFVGTYGQMSFTPKDMQDASKTSLDKWSLAAYGSVQHDNGFYIDTLLSYGIIKGDITNAIIGKTAKLKNAKMLSISTTVGKQFATRMEGLTFEPQAQLAYQHLLFDTISDVDNFTIDMNNPHQWLIRVGGRLTKTVVTAENGRSISFYGKVNAVKTLGDNEAIHIDKNYQRDSVGSFIEGGLGISAQLSPNISLHGDVSAQQKLQKTGITGASFSGGIRYQF